MLIGKPTGAENKTWTRLLGNILLHMQNKLKITYIKMLYFCVWLTKGHQINHVSFNGNGIREKSEELAYLRHSVGLRARLFTNSEFKCMRSNRFTQWVDPVPSFPIASAYVFRRKMGLQIVLHVYKGTLSKESFEWIYDSAWSDTLFCWASCFNGHVACDIKIKY